MQNKDDLLDIIERLQIRIAEVIEIAKRSIRSEPDCSSTVSKSDMLMIIAKLETRR